MAQPLNHADAIRQDTPTVEQVDYAHACGDDIALMRLLILSNVAAAGHLDRIASALERLELAVR
jgi:hypothetical protein